MKRTIKLVFAIIAQLLIGGNPAAVTQTHPRRAYRPHWPPALGSVDDILNYNLAAGRLAVVWSE